VVETLATLDQAMTDLRFDAAAQAVYRFAWDTFCDWYIEFIKGNFDAETKAVAGWVLDQILVMLHPFMPFVTEELWHALGERETDLILARWPEPGAAVDAGAKAEVEWLIALVSASALPRTNWALRRAPSSKHGCPNRARRRGRSSPPTARRSTASRGCRPSISPCAAGRGDAGRGGRRHAHRPARRPDRHRGGKGPPRKALATSEKEAKALAGRLSNPSFVERAKPEAVEKARADHAHHTAEAERLSAALKRLG
jgi:valyl-tRNA synthetase